MIEPGPPSSASGNASETPRSRRRSSSLKLAFLGLVVLCAIGIFGYVTQSGVSSSRAWVLHTYDVRSGLQDLETQLAEARASALGYAASGDESQLKDFRAHSVNTERVLQNLRILTADNERQQYRLTEMQGSSRKYLSELESLATLAAPRVAQNSSESHPIRDLEMRESEQRELVQAMADDEQLLLKGRVTTWDHFFLRNTLILIVTLLVAVIFLAFNFRLLVREISRTRELERMQRESTRSARALSSRVLELQDAERRKVARELHDSVGQYLVGLKINLEQLLRNNPALSATHVKLLNDTVELTERSLSEVRTISHLLHPPLLDEIGLESAAQWYVDGFAKRCGLKVSLRLVNISDRFPKEVELALFRVLQESLTNVHRHANATTVDISLACANGCVTLAVQDDGDGISNQVLDRYRSGLASGVGLAGMQERLAELHGVLEVEAGARGTVVKATIPSAECQLQPDPLEARSV